MTAEQRVPLALLFLRLSVFLVMLMWTLDKWVNPAYATQVYAHFYSIRGLSPWVFYAIGGAELLLLLGFLVGLQKRFTYAAVLVLHAVSTGAAFRQSLSPFSNLLFFASDARGLLHAVSPAGPGHVVGVEEW